MKVTVLGTGAYGLALANMLNQNNNEIILWSKFEEEITYLQKENKAKVLPNIKLPSNFKYTFNMEEAVNKSKLIIIAVPAGAVNEVSKQLAKYYKKDMHICIASKGIEQNSCLFVSSVVEKYIKTKKLAVISGGTFAIDMFNNCPLGLSLATRNKNTSLIVKEALENKYLKLRTTNDIIGIEICGSIKNVIAIASGMLSGLGYPDSTSCMFITESLNDIKNLIKALGGNKKTILSFAGFGDLLLTCTSTKSRNYTLGKMIGERKPKEEIDNYINNTTIEGLYTLKSIYKLLRRKKVKMPIIDLIYNIIFKETDPDKLASFLITKD